MNSAVIVAGGSGNRFGSKIPKQFIKIDGQEILAFSVKTFLEHPEIDEVIIVSHLEWIKIVSENYSDCKVVEGGKRRQDSSLNGIRATSENTENVLIHDAARPFIAVSGAPVTGGNGRKVAPGSVMHIPSEVLRWKLPIAGHQPFVRPADYFDTAFTPVDKHI